MIQAATPPFWRTLATRERIGWIVYDWANSVFVLCIITVIGSAYFVGVFESAARAAGDLRVGPALALRVGGLAITAEAAWSLVVGLSAGIVAITSPILGTLADGEGQRRRFLQLYCALGVLATLALWFKLPWWGVGLLILVGNVGYEGGNVFYNAFLPDIASAREQDQLSSAGYAFGYVGSVMVLIAVLIWFVPPRGEVRNAFLLVGVWWGAWALLTFAWVRERVALRKRAVGLGRWAAAWGELRRTIGQVSRTPQAALFLLAFLLYNDGIATLISNATPYALQNIYLDRELTKHITLNELIPAIVMIQIIGFPGALFCGWLAVRRGVKFTLYFSLIVFSAVVAYAQVATLVHEFYVMCAAIGVVIGGAQAVSRSLFATFIPQGRNAEFFAFFALSSKFSAMIGPIVYGGLLLMTGDTRLSILSLTVFFALGAFVLYFVDVEQGRAAAARTA